ncbi:MAG: hypothetical protein ACXVKK_15905, partial [Flavisolibacter sp.]
LILIETSVLSKPVDMSPMMTGRKEFRYRMIRLILNDVPTISPSYGFVGLLLNTVSLKVFLGSISFVIRVTTSAIVSSVRSLKLSKGRRNRSAIFRLVDLILVAYDSNIASNVRLLSSKRKTETHKHSPT